MKRFIVSCQQHPFFSVTSTHLFPCLPSTPSPIHTLSYTLSPPLAHKFFHTNSLTHLHATGIVFRDLKPENIMLDNIKSFLVGLIFQSLMKVGGGVLLTVGISSQSWTEIISAIVTIIIGLIAHAVSLNTAVQTAPPGTKVGS